MWWTIIVFNEGGTQWCHLDFGKIINPLSQIFSKIKIIEFTIIEILLISCVHMQNIVWKSLKPLANNFDMFIVYKVSIIHFTILICYMFIVYNYSFMRKICHKIFKKKYYKFQSLLVFPFLLLGTHEIFKF